MLLFKKHLPNFFLATISVLTEMGVKSAVLGILGAEGFVAGAIGGLISRACQNSPFFSYQYMKTKFRKSNKEIGWTNSRYEDCFIVSLKDGLDCFILFVKSDNVEQQLIFKQRIDEAKEKINKKSICDFFEIGTIQGLLKGDDITTRKTLIYLFGEKPDVACLLDQRIVLEFAKRFRAIYFHNLTQNKEAYVELQLMQEAVLLDKINQIENQLKDLSSDKLNKKVKKADKKEYKKAYLQLKNKNRGNNYLNLARNTIESILSCQEKAYLELEIILIETKECMSKIENQLNDVSNKVDENLTLTREIKDSLLTVRLKAFLKEVRQALFYLSKNKYILRTAKYIRYFIFAFMLYMGFVFVGTYVLGWNMVRNHLGWWCVQLKCYKEASNLFYQSARTGDPSGQVSIYDLYSSRLKNDKTAVAWLDSAVSQKYPSAYRLKGNLCFGDRNYEEAIKWYEMDPNVSGYKYKNIGEKIFLKPFLRYRIYQFEPSHKYMLGYSYFKIDSIQQAIRNLEKSAKRNHYNASYLLGKIYLYYSDDIEKDSVFCLNEAEKWIKKALKENDASGYSEYLYGDLFKRRGDIKNAEVYYKRSYQKGYKRAYWELADLLLIETEFRPMQKGEMLSSLKMMAQEDPKACLFLADNYFANDPDLMSYWYVKAEGFEDLLYLNDKIKIYEKLAELNCNISNYKIALNYYGKRLGITHTFTHNPKDSVQLHLLYDYSKNNNDTISLTEACMYLYNFCSYKEYLIEYLKLNSSGEVKKGTNKFYKNSEDVIIVESRDHALLRSFAEYFLDSGDYESAISCMIRMSKYRDSSSIDGFDFPPILKAIAHYKDTLGDIKNAIELCKIGYTFNTGSVSFLDKIFELSNQDTIQIKSQTITRLRSGDYKFEGKYNADVYYVW